MLRGYPQPQGLYDPRFERDSCGVGFLCHIKGKASHKIVEDALLMLENMNHRGACGCEANSGDGAGILVRTPDKFLRRKCKELGINLPPLGRYGVAMCFLPKDMVARHECEQTLERIARENGMVVLGWRDVPTNSRSIGPTPKRSEPKIRQCFVAPDERFFNKADFDRRLYLVRQRAENVVEFNSENKAAREGFYINLMSANRLVYKGMLTATQLRDYYPDLSEPDFESALAMIHSRFSTNTFPSWDRAHPYRYLAHNGEINTLRGNRNWMRARYGALQSAVFGDELQKMYPILTESGSDSATLDNMIQFLCVNGRTLPHAVLMVIPEAWQQNDLMDPDLKAFYEYHACLMEPWDGPAAMVFTNGVQIGATLDRNGLRPARYIVTDDDHLIMASEAGVLPVPEEKIVRKWRLQPGKMLLIDFEEGRIVDDDEIKRKLAAEHPYAAWLEATQFNLSNLPDLAEEHREEFARATVPIRPNDPSVQLKQQQAFGYTQEDIQFFLEPMARDADDPVGSMGTDTPLAVLADLCAGGQRLALFMDGSL